MALIGSITTGERPGDSLGIRGQNVLIPYPEGLIGLAEGGTDGEPASLLQALWDAGMVVVDPRRPLLGVREIDGRMWTMLTVDASTAVSALLERTRKPAPAAPRGVACSTQAPALGTTPPNRRIDDGAHPAATDTAKARTRGNASRAIANEIRTLCESGQVPTERVANGLLIEHATLSAISAERGVPAAKLRWRLQLQPEFLSDPRGVVLVQRP
jgi:conjugal transfer pilus assembly protein TraI